MKHSNCRRDDRGETTTQTVIIVPVIITLLFLVVHIAILAHASHIAQVAAQRGAEVAASANGSVTQVNEAIVQAARVAKDMGATVNVSPVLQADGRSVGMTVRLSTQALVPFLPHVVERTVWVAEEKFVMEQDR